MWLVFLIGWFGMSLGNALASYFLTKDFDEWFTSSWYLTCGYIISTCVWALN